MALTDWSYRKKITITGQTGASTNYQIKLLIGETSGATGEDFDVDNKSVSFPSAKNISGDLRFTTSNGETLLDFWVESVTGTTPNRLATIWVEVSADLGSNQDIYCYYGGTTTNVSSGVNTFILFDDFDGAADAVPDASKWNKTYTVTQRGDSTVRIGGTSGQYNGLHSIGTYGEGYAILTSAYVHNTTVGTSNSGSFGNSVNPGSTIGYDNRWNAPKERFVWDGGYNTVGAQTGSYKIFETKRKGSGASELLVDGTSISTKASGGGSTVTPITAWAYSSDYNYMDWVAVKKCQATEPAFNTAGSQEGGVSNQANFLAFF